MVRELVDALDAIENRHDINILVIRGTDETFCLGAAHNDWNPEQTLDVYGIQKWERLCQQLDKLDKITLSVIEGGCVGVGLQLALNCDIRLARSCASFSLNEVKLGYLSGAAFHLAKYIGLGRAKHLMLSGKGINGNQAFDWGLIDAVSETAPAFESEIVNMIETLLPFHADALILTRRLLNESYASAYENFEGHFLAAQHRAINSEPFQRLIKDAR